MKLKKLHCRAYEIVASNQISFPGETWLENFARIPEADKNQSRTRRSFPGNTTRLVRQHRLDARPFLVAFRVAWPLRDC
jgi:hypothetical protein